MQNNELESRANGNFIKIQCIIVHMGIHWYELEILKSLKKVQRNQISWKSLTKRKNQIQNETHARNEKKNKQNGSITK